MSLHRIEQKLDSILKHLEKVMATQADLEKQLTDLSTQLDKVIGEVQKDLADLKAALDAAGTVTPGVQTAFDKLAAKVQALDDLNPDAAP